jgi:hypothetical protein
MNRARYIIKKFPRVDVLQFPNPGLLCRLYVPEGHASIMSSHYQAFAIGGESGAM